MFGLKQRRGFCDVVTDDSIQVSNYMAIKEARVNGELARSSMEIAKVTARDSSAMKSIAVLTMVFLPATAVAVSILSTRPQIPLTNS